jgi:hypothetical protein
MNLHCVVSLGGSNTTFMHSALGATDAAAAAAKDCEEILRKIHPHHPWIAEMAAAARAGSRNSE